MQTLAENSTVAHLSVMTRMISVGAVILGLLIRDNGNEVHWYIHWSGMMAMKFSAERVCLQQRNSFIHMMNS